MYYNNKRFALSIFWLVLGVVLLVLSLTEVLDSSIYAGFGGGRKHRRRGKHQGTFHQRHLRPYGCPRLWQAVRCNDETLRAKGGGQS